MQSFATSLKSRNSGNGFFFTLGILVVYRIGVAIPIPGIDAGAIQQLFKSQANNFLGFLGYVFRRRHEPDVHFRHGGDALHQFVDHHEFASGAHVIPYWTGWRKKGKQDANGSTNHALFHLVLGAHSVVWVDDVDHEDSAGRQDIAVVREPGALFVFTTVITLTAGTVFIMWLGEQITELGIGNGISLMIFTGIVDRIPERA
jgi:preprotein translocase subunit SecY